MSGIRVNEWLHNSGTGGIWQTSAGNVGIASSVPTTKLEVTGDAKISGVTTATTFVPTEGQLSHRRLNVNGAFTVSQKNGSTAKTSISGSDRWVDLIQHYSSNGGTFTVQRVSDDAPTGYQYSAKYTVTTPNSSLANGDEDMVIHRIEGQDLAHLSWGSASAKTITLSFWVKSSLTGDFSVTLQGGGGRCYVTAYTISSADTWEQKTVTIPGETSGTWVINANAGLAIIWDLGAGSTYEASSADTWLSVANVYRKAGTVRYSATNTATWQITGIQFEVGSVATPFEHRSYADELARCQRYCHVKVAGGAYSRMSLGYAPGSANDVRWFCFLNPRMRDTPSSYSYSGAFTCQPGSSFDIADVTLEASSSSPDCAILHTDDNTGMSAGQAVSLHANNDTNAKLIFIAEM